MLARKKFPGSPASLDALCKKFGVSLQKRTKHGALTDTELLAEVFLYLSGGREPGLNLKTEEKPKIKTVITKREFTVFQRTIPLPSRLTQTEIELHESFIQTELKNSIWKAAPISK
jgi:DNA polymerase III subunit epsilon